MNVKMDLSVIMDVKIYWVDTDATARLATSSTMIGIFVLVNETLLLCNFYIFFKQNYL